MVIEFVEERDNRRYSCDICGYSSSLENVVQHEKLPLKYYKNIPIGIGDYILFNDIPCRVLGLRVNHKHIIFPVLLNIYRKQIDMTMIPLWNKSSVKNYRKLNKKDCKKFMVFFGLEKPRRKKIE